MDLIYFVPHTELVAFVKAIAMLDDRVLLFDAFMQDRRVSLLEFPMQLCLRNGLYLFKPNLLLLLGS